MDALHVAEVVGTLHEDSAGLPPSSLASPSREEKTELLPLDLAERVIVYAHLGKTYRHFFRRIVRRDPDNYYRFFSAEVEKEKSGVRSTTDLQSPPLALYDGAILRVEGFPTGDGKSPHEYPGWPEKIRLVTGFINHKFTAVDLLTRVWQPEDPILVAEGMAVSLKCLWSEDEAKRGGMKRYSNLIHRFSGATFAQERRLNRARMDHFTPGGSRTEKTIMRSAAANDVTLALYDELIESVEGYSAGGVALLGKEAIAREMDPFHKAVAVTALFPGPNPRGVDVGGKE